ncbi:MAG: hypothetical protein HY456_00540 [Parcubacteria group bacterium]|nr:hypothetical protein [Parcubacteria group bacterium]
MLNKYKVVLKLFFGALSLLIFGNYFYQRLHKDEEDKAKHNAEQQAALSCEENNPNIHLFVSCGGFS